MMPDQGPQSRELSEPEFNAIRDRLLDEAPDGLSEQDFQRWIGPRMESAIAEAEYGPAKPEGSATGRFVGSMASMLNPIEAVKGVYQAVRHPLDTLEGIGAASAEQWQKANEARDAGNITESLARRATSVPIVGPMIAAIGDQFGSGDIAGGLGSAAGAAVPLNVGRIARGAKATGRAAFNLMPDATRNRVAASLQRGAESRVVDVIAPKSTSKLNIQRGKDVAQHADEVTKLLAEEGAPSSRAGLRAMVADKADEVARSLDDVSNARPNTLQMETQPIIDELMARRANFTAESVKGSKLDPGPRGETVPLGRDVVPGPNAPRVATIDAMIDELRRLGPIAPYESVRRIRQSWDAVAKETINAAVTPDYNARYGAKLGARDGTGVLRDALAASDPATAAVNAKYHVWRTIDDVMEAAEDLERVRPKVGRTIMARLTGVLFGGTAGGTTGAVAGAVIAPALEAALSSGTTKLHTARMMTRLANAVRRGDAAGVDAAARNLGAFGRRAQKAAAAEQFDAEFVREPQKPPPNYTDAEFVETPAPGLPPGRGQAQITGGMDDPRALPPGPDEMPPAPVGPRQVTPGAGPAGLLPEGRPEPRPPIPLGAVPEPRAPIALGPVPEQVTPSAQVTPEARYSAAVKAQTDAAKAYRDKQISAEEFVSARREFEAARDALNPEDAALAAKRNAAIAKEAAAPKLAPRPRATKPTPATVQPATTAPAQTPASAAADVREELARVVDVSGAKTAAEVQKRVLATLQQELAASRTPELDAIEAWTVRKRVKPGSSGEPTKPKELGARLVAANNEAKRKTVTIQIPGDGTFTVARNPTALNEMIRRVTKAGPSAWKGLGAQKR